MCKTNNTITNNCMSKDNTLNMSITHTIMSNCIIFENMACSSAHNLMIKHTLENRTLRNPEEYPTMQRHSGRTDSTAVRAACLSNEYAGRGL